MFAAFLCGSPSGMHRTLFADCWNPARVATKKSGRQVKCHSVFPVCARDYTVCDSPVDLRQSCTECVENPTVWAFI